MQLLRRPRLSIAGGTGRRVLRLLGIPSWGAPEEEGISNQLPV
jgi:hypothetical protein